MIRKANLSKALLTIGLTAFFLIGGFSVSGYADPYASGYENRISPNYFSKLIAGTYVVSRDPADGTSFILTIFADGNVSSIQSIQFEGGVSNNPFSDQQGVWKRTGHRKIKATLPNMNFIDIPGEVRGIAIAYYDLEFSKDFRAIKGESIGMIYAPGVDPQNPDEDPLDTFTDNFFAERLNVGNDN